MKFSIPERFESHPESGGFRDYLDKNSYGQFNPKCVIAGGYRARYSHTGPYQFLGNAWGALYSRQRSKFFRINKKVHPFEIYHKNPGRCRRMIL